MLPWEKVVIHCFLARGTKSAATVYCFDIQAAAVKQPELLTRHGLEQKVKLISANHATVGEHVGLGMLEVAMFNLGYLPGGDHLLITKPQTGCCGFYLSAALAGRWFDFRY